MSARPFVRSLAAMLLLGALGHDSSSWAAQRLQAPELIALPRTAIGDLAVGDVDGDGIPEVASFGGDRKVHVFQRQSGAWREVYTSSSGATITNPPNQTPTVRFTSQPEIAPGAGFHNGQFLFNCQAPGIIIVSIRQSTGGTWSEQTVFGPIGGITNGGVFSPPGLLRAENNPTQSWRLILAGGDAFDPPSHAYLPRFGQSAPYAHIDYSTGSSGYCESSSLVSDARIGDFDGDGINEIALLRYNKLFVTGTLAATTSGNPTSCWPYQQVSLPGPGPHAQMLAGRLNGDATTDLVVRDANGTLTRLLATPGLSTPYTFTISSIPSNVPGAQSSTDLTSADLDGDGDLDLVQSFRAPPGVEVLINTGGGSFSSTFVPLDADSGAAEAVAIGDMDGDGKLDLVLAQPNASPSRLLILPGHGDGTFGLPASASLGTLEPSAVAIALLDDDAVPDLLVGGIDSDLSDGLQPLVTLRGTGGGAFAAPVKVGAPFANPYVGLKRLVPFRRETGAPVSVAALQYDSEQEGDEDGFGAMGPLVRTYGPVTGAMTGLDRADMDQSGVTERIHLERLADGSSQVFIDYVDATIPLPGAQSGVRAVDWNGDGLLDLVTLNNDLKQLEVRLMDPSGDFSFPTLLTYPLDEDPIGDSGDRAAPFVVVPLTGPGNHRMLVVRELQSGTGHPMLQVFTNDPPNVGAIYDMAVSPGGTPIGIDVGDMDGDGIPDVVVGEVSGTTHESFVSILRGVPFFGAFERNATFVLPGTTLNDLAVGDLDADGRNDMVTVTDVSLVNAPRTGRSKSLTTTGTGGLVIVPGKRVPNVTTSVGGPAAPVAPRLEMAIAPNPGVGGPERLSFRLPTASRVTVDLIDLGGRRLRRVLDIDRTTGTYSEPFTMTDANGRLLAAGVYFLQLRAGNTADTRRIVMMR